MKRLILTAGLPNAEMTTFVEQLQRDDSNIYVFDAFQERLNQYGTLDTTHSQDVTVYNRIYNLLTRQFCKMQMDYLCCWTAI